MSIHVALNHVTHYRYDRRVALGPQVVRLRPAPHCRTPILSYSLRIEPAEHFINWQQDPFANYLARLVVPEKTAEFKITVDLVAQMAVYNPFDFFLEPSAENYPFSYDDGLKRELAPYLVAQRLHHQPAAVAAGARAQRQRLLGRLHAGLHADHVADVALQALVQADQEVDRALLVLGQAVDQLLQLGRQRRGHEVGREFAL